MSLADFFFLFILCVQVVKVYYFSYFTDPHKLFSPSQWAREKGLATNFMTYIKMNHFNMAAEFLRESS